MSLKKSKDNYKEKYFRLMADIENIKLRYIRDIENIKKISCESAIRSFLPIIDSIELIYKNTSNEKIRSSIKVTLRITSTMFKNSNVSIINPNKFEKFNPLIHQAIVSIKMPVKENLIFSVLQKGYFIEKKLLRPALVSVTCK
ncbi:nucleotide exchange factor GrpE [Candidatus Vidania fulgoroideae]|uniref:Protein GrpE n=1 Tax=Candidatus Vidania fulgoroideorum TaxID=881286 RepID=A0A975AEI2_9PROT|nr:nucleotide exchange factor GrpE [Candidatus Vidania fulgoroideae]